MFFRRVNGDRYEGEWRNGRMHGKGVKVMANGDVYNGTWENDKAEGNGVKVRKRGAFFFCVLVQGMSGCVHGACILREHDLEKDTTLRNG